MKLKIAIKRCVVNRRRVKLSRRPHNYRGVPRDVTRDDVITDDDDEDERDVARCGAGVTTTTEWRLSRLWVDETDVYHQDPFIVAPSPHRPAAAAAAGDDDDEGEFVERRRRRSRPDLVPRQSSSVTSPAARHDRQLNNTCDDVTLLHRLPRQAHCHCLPVSSADVIT